LIFPVIFTKKQLASLVKHDGIQGTHNELLHTPGNPHSFKKVRGRIIPSTSQKAGLTSLYKKFLFLSTTAISKPVFQEVNGTVILPLTFIKE
jgi:hypothetical protein